MAKPGDDHARTALRAVHDIALGSIPIRSAGSAVSPARRWPQLAIALLWLSLTAAPERASGAFANGEGIVADAAAPSVMAPVALEPIPAPVMPSPPVDGRPVVKPVVASQPIYRPLGPCSTKRELGDLDETIIRRYVQWNEAQIRYCYQSRLNDNPVIAGTMRTHFLLSCNGDVTAVTATGVDAELASCVAGAIKAIRFPEAGSTAEINYPFHFVARSRRAGPIERAMP
jgi:hypothetical protein